MTNRTDPEDPDTVNSSTAEPDTETSDASVPENAVSDTVRSSTADPGGLALALAAARAADDKGATDIAVLDVGDVLGICGYFVLASASNPRQVKAVVDHVEELVAEQFGERPRSVEGADGRRWVLLDFADVVVHVFHVEEREYYRIERLYTDAPRQDWRG